MKSLTTHFDTARRVAKIIWRDGLCRHISHSSHSSHPYCEHHTFNEWHLGDNLIHLNFLRRLAARSPHEKFVHACRECYLGQLRPVVADLPNIQLVSLKDMHPGSINSWKNYGKWTGGGGYFDRSDKQADFVEFHLTFFNDLARRMGTTSPMGCADDFLFNYPAIRSSLPGQRMVEFIMPGRWDVLVCNSTPQSNQLPGWKEHNWNEVIAFIINSGHSVVCTQQTQTGAPCTADYGVRTPRRGVLLPGERFTPVAPNGRKPGETGLDVTGVGNVSLRCGLIVGCPCGPMWPTWNVWNKDTPRIVVHGKETLNIGWRTQHARSKAELFALLEARWR